MESSPEPYLFMPMCFRTANKVCCGNGGQFAGMIICGPTLSVMIVRSMFSANLIIARHLLTKVISPVNLKQLRILEELGNYCHVSSSTIFRSSERHVRCRLFTKSDSHPKVCSVDGLPMLLEEFEELDRESKTVGKSQKVKVKKQNAT
ncbi:hypothetical protein V6N11_049137 [Hibiscus sabdariffa]|uniref:Uncharacterized protein n=1 Tax=Hibiscus sabdariffa TaxID=183260 RepID=A0ABR2PXA9_9ROSI